MALFRRTKRSRRRKNEEISMRRHVIFGLVWIITVVTVCVLVWYVARLQAVTISVVTVTGGETISNETLHSLVEQELRGTYYLLIPKRFSYLYPKDRIREVLENVPRVHSVEIVKPTQTSLAITFSEYVPHALWCLTDADYAECYFMDEEGYAFAIAPALRGGAFVRHVMEGTEKLDEGQVLDTETVDTVNTFIEALEKELSVRVVSVQYEESGDTTYTISGGGSFLLSNDIPIEDSFKNLVSILTSEEFKHIEPGNFNYIDLRFGNKIFVNEELEKEVVATTTLPEVDIQKEEPLE